MHLHVKNSEVCIKTRSTPALLPPKGQVTEQTTVKWSIAKIRNKYMYLENRPKKLPALIGWKLCFYNSMET